MRTMERMLHTVGPAWTVSQLGVDPPSEQTVHAALVLAASRWVTARWAPGRLALLDSDGLFFPCLLYTSDAAHDLTRFTYSLDRQSCNIIQKLYHYQSVY